MQLSTWRQTLVNQGCLTMQVLLCSSERFSISFSSAARRELFPLPTIPATPTSSPWLTESSTSTKACLNSGTVSFLTPSLFD